MGSEIENNKTGVTRRTKARVLTVPSDEYGLTGAPVSGELKVAGSYFNRERCAVLSPPGTRAMRFADPNATCVPRAIGFKQAIRSFEREHASLAERQRGYREFAA
jgi:hypothetical protein